MRLKVGRVTLQAAGNDGAVEIRKAVAIAWAVHPPQIFPIRDWQLKELVFVPEQVGLALFAGADHHREAFRAWVGARYCGLEKTALLRSHLKIKIWIYGLEDVVAGGEFAQDGVFGGRGGG